MVSVISSSSPSACISTKKPKDASTPTELFESVMREQWRREQQRRRMVCWRQQKKESVASMVQERRQLERELQWRLADARVATDGFVPRTIDEAVRLSTIDLASLTREDLVLQETIAQHVKFENIVDKETLELIYPVQEKETPPKSSAKTNKKPVFQLPGDGGWRVYFPDGEPSFYFSPFTKEQFNDILNKNDIVYAERHPSNATVGKIFGWNVDYAPLAKNADGSSNIAHARFSKRLSCSIDKSQRILPRLDKKLWPVVVTPRSWGRTQTGSVNCQELQNFNKHVHVAAYNIPGEVNLRYVALARHTREKNSEGKRVDKYIITVTV